MCPFKYLLLNIATVLSLTCNEFLNIQEKKISLEELQTMLPKEIILCLGHLGEEQLPNSNAQFIWQSIVDFYDGIVNIPDQVLMLLHWVTIAVTPENYYNMTLSNIDVIQNFGFNYNLSEGQLSAIANRVREDFAEKEPEDYTYYDLAALGQIICAFNKSEIERIHPKAYKEAAFLIGKLERCSPEVMTGFAKLAIQKYAFGLPENWSNATIKIVGNLVEYLPPKLKEKMKYRRNPV